MGTGQAPRNDALASSCHPPLPPTDKEYAAKSTACEDDDLIPSAIALSK